jgi:hypothetical protein
MFGVPLVLYLTFTVVGFKRPRELVCAGAAKCKRAMFLLHPDSSLVRLSVEAKYFTFT